MAAAWTREVVGCEKWVERARAAKLRSSMPLFAGSAHLPGRRCRSGWRVLPRAPRFSVAGTCAQVRSTIRKPWWRLMSLCVGSSSWWVVTTYCAGMFSTAR